MRGWVHEVDDKHERFVHAVDKADLDILAAHCAELRADGAGNGKDEKLAMRADGFTIMAWCDKVGVTWQKFWTGSDHKELQERFIQDPDNAAFRVWGGRL